MVESMEPLEALKIIEKRLQEKGYRTRRAEEDGEYVLEVSSPKGKARIRFHQQLGKLIELHLKYENTPGLTVLKCERYQETLSCIEDLIARF
ncbi:MAG: hypothetical protein ABWK01_09125 [Infirmifilum sp.]